MRHPPPARQPSDDTVSIGNWELDEDFPYGPQGAKPKRIVICPTPSPKSYLVAGHRYLFKEPVGFREQQIWSEVIAYELGKAANVPIPPAFLAYDPHMERQGVLVEFFYGLPWEPPLRFVHAIDRFQGLSIPVNAARGSLRDNVRLCRAHRITNWKEWWAQTLAFDALIGNTDRHSENWGFLVHREASQETRYSLAPAFDNGTSLGFAIADKDLAKYIEPNQLAKFVAKGTHHYGWLSGDNEGAQHVALCHRFMQVFGNASGPMADVIQLSDESIRSVLDWCTRFNSYVPFTRQRADFVFALIKFRQAALVRALGE